MADLRTLNQTTYELTQIGETKPIIKVGGSLTEKFVPNINKSFECESGQEKFFFNLNRKDVVITTEKESVKDGVISLLHGEQKDLFHVDEKGNFCWDIEFASKPESLVIEWEIACSPELEFLYQPPLTQEQIDDGAERPDSVVGSYAVYCNGFGHRKRKDGSTVVNYRTGKLFHIYRPLCIDADKKTAWCELEIADGKLRITLPKAFMDSARYPVLLDPYFGETSCGASIETTSSTGWIYTQLKTSGADDAGAVTKVYGAWYNASSVTTGTAVMGVFEGAPDGSVEMGEDSISVLPQTNNGDCEEGYQYIDVSGDSYTLKASTGYYFGWEIKYYNLRMKADSGGSYSRYSKQTTDWTATDWTSGTAYNNWSMYLEYTEAGGETYTASGSLSASGAYSRHLNFSRSQSGAL